MIKYKNKYEKFFQSKLPYIQIIDPNYRVKNYIQNNMIYTDLIRLVGQYITYDEFTKAHPEIELTQTDWYSLLEGITMRNHKTELKKRYLEQFEIDWAQRRQVALNVLQEQLKEQGKNE